MEDTPSDLLQLRDELFKVTDKLSEGYYDVVDLTAKIDSSLKIGMTSCKKDISAITQDLDQLKGDMNRTTDDITESKELILSKVNATHGFLKGAISDLDKKMSDHFLTSQRQIAKLQSEVFDGLRKFTSLAVQILHAIEVSRNTIMTEGSNAIERLRDDTADLAFAQAQHLTSQFESLHERALQAKAFEDENANGHCFRPLSLFQEMTADAPESSLASSPLTPGSTLADEGVDMDSAVGNGPRKSMAELQTQYHRDPKTNGNLPFEERASRKVAKDTSPCICTSGDPGSAGIFGDRDRDLGSQNTNLNGLLGEFVSREAANVPPLRSEPGSTSKIDDSNSGEKQATIALLNDPPEDVRNAVEPLETEFQVPLLQYLKKIPRIHRFDAKSRLFYPYLRPSEDMSNRLKHMYTSSVARLKATRIYVQTATQRPVSIRIVLSFAVLLQPLPVGDVDGFMFGDLELFQEC
ncbi:hypothetical protein NLJ89_g8248 [Agrocybe chaxingu]|uniref:Uncharacterized protein n=1 Tax=Agrocybe chaxingu TaxID=84603 RepID=A0A9W8K248_9AGAR|nr:hypothetical protein NLJ89_g8248 [Agrocybe chaxingu]